MKIEANKEPSVLIKETEKHNIHVLLTRKGFNERDPLATMSEFDVIQIFTPEEFEAMQRRHSKPDEWVKIAGFVSARVVHDGRLETKEEGEVIEPDSFEKAVQAKAEALMLKEQEKKRRVKAAYNKTK